MIRIVKKCLGKTKIEEKKWDWHFAGFHFKDFENHYLIKPATAFKSKLQIKIKQLRPWDLLKNGYEVRIITD